MEIIYFLIPIALVLVAGIVVGLFWAVKSGQFDDMEGPAYQILMDEEVYAEKKTDKNKPDKQKQQRK
jgi:cbb3-type cytochrome oxidase maturation protein